MRMTLLGVFSLAACSGVIDTGSGDDTTVPPPTDVQIVVRDGALPQPNVQAIFQTADNTVVAEVVTDLEGRAIAEMPDGGNLTIIRSYPLPPAPEEPRPPEVYTYVGVKPGDRLVLENPTAENAPTSAINVIVPETAAGTIKVKTPCGSGQGTAPIVPVTLKGCSPDAFYVMDGDQGSFFVHAPYSENVDVSTGSLLGALSSSLSATNVPLGTTVTIEKRIESEGFLLYTSNPQRVDETPANVNVPQLEGLEQVLVVMSSANNRTQVVATHSLFARGPSAVDATAGLIASVSEAPTFAPTGITWVEEGIGAPDFVISTLQVTRGGPVNPNNKYVRTIIAPYAGTSLQLPVLPGANVLFNPTMEDQINLALGLAKVTGGYDGVRASAFTGTNIIDVTPLDGQLTLSYAGNAPGL